MSFSQATGTFTDLVSGITLSQSAAQSVGQICVTSDGSDPLCNTTNNTCLTGNGGNANQWSTKHGGTFGVANSVTVKARACVSNSSSTITSQTYTVNLPGTSYRTGTNLAEPFTSASGSEGCDPGNTGAANCNPQRFLRIETGSDTGPVPGLGTAYLCHTTDGSNPSVTAGTCTGSQSTVCTGTDLANNSLLGNTAGKLTTALDPTTQINAGSIATNANGGALGITVPGLHKTTQFRSVLCRISTTAITSNSPQNANGTESVLTPTTSDRTVAFTGYSRGLAWNGANEFEPTPGNWVAEETFYFANAANKTLDTANKFFTTWNSQYLYIGAQVAGLRAGVPNGRYLHAYFGLKGLDGTTAADPVASDNQNTLSMFPSGNGGARYHLIYNGVTKAVSLRVWNGQAWVAGNSTGIGAVDGNVTTDYVLVRIPWANIESPTEFVVGAAVTSGGNAGTINAFPTNGTNGEPFTRANAITRMFDRGSILPPAGPRAGGFKYAGQAANNVPGANASALHRNVNWNKVQWDPYFGQFIGGNNVSVACSTSATSVVATLAFSGGGKANPLTALAVGSEGALSGLAALLTTPATWGTGNSGVAGGVNAGCANLAVRYQTSAGANSNNQTIKSITCDGATVDASAYWTGVTATVATAAETTPSGVVFAPGAACAAP